LGHRGLTHQEYDELIRHLQVKEVNGKILIGLLEMNPPMEKSDVDLV
jgi:hypothetical protein